MSVLTFVVRKILLLLVMVSCRGSEPAPSALVASVPAPVPVAAPIPAPAPAPVPVPAPPSAIPTRVPKGFAAKLVGAMTLNYDISDRGVAYFGTAESNLSLELQANADGAFTLKVTGKGVRKGGFLNPTAKTQSQADPPQAFTVDDTWVGHWTALDGRPVIHVEGQKQMGWQKGRGNTGIELRPAARDFVCTKVAAAAATAGGAAALEHLRCDLATPDTKPSWQGEFPAYLRVPLIFGLNSSVRSSVLVYDQRVDLSVSAIPLR